MYQYNVGPALTPLPGAAEETACGLLLLTPAPTTAITSHRTGSIPSAAITRTAPRRTPPGRSVRCAGGASGWRRSSWERIRASPVRKKFTKNLVRIRSMGQLAGAAGALIRREIQEPSD